MNKLFTEETLGDYYNKVIIPEGLEDFILNEYEIQDINPSYSDIFRALRLTPLNKVKVVIFGQDPYPTKGVADGLAFSVRKGTKAPMSIRNMFTEINSEYNTDVIIDKKLNADLSDWAIQGVLLLNTVLTVRVGHSKSHSKKGWEVFTDSIVKTICENNNTHVFILFGGDAAKKEKIIKGDNNHIIKAVHPSPLSASKGFFGCNVFKDCNKILINNNIEPIDWIGIR